MELEKTKALTAGVAGALVLNAAHETARKLVPNAPHIDLLAMRALGLYILRPLGMEVPLKSLRRWTLAGDLVSNSLYYGAMILTGRRTALWKRSWAWGLTAGAVVVCVPPLLKLGQQKSRNLPVTASLTFAWYTLGALAAAALYRAATSIRTQAPG